MDSLLAELAPTARAVQRFADVLRRQHTAWRACAAHLPSSVGSMATDLTVLLDDRGRPHLLLLPQAAHTPLALALQDQLCKQGFGARAAAAFGLAISSRVAADNARSVALSRTLTEHSREHVLVLRVSIRAVTHVTACAASNTVWFCSGHANLCMVDTRAQIVCLVEPAGREIIRCLPALLGNALVSDSTRGRYRTFHNMHMFAPGVPLAATNDDLCTIWCALFAMVGLANPVDSPERFWTVVRWTHTHRSRLMSMMLLHLARVLGPTW